MKARLYYNIAILPKKNFIMLKQDENCPLCREFGSLIYKNNNIHYYQCGNCLAVFTNDDSKPSFEVEKSIYEQHENIVEDFNYQKFVSPITLSVMRDFNPNSKGLDFGAGTGPVITKVLRDNNYDISPYDPIFHNYKELLGERYDYISSCEVIEHFHYPYKEFALLKSMLHKDGKLYCMTEIYDDSIEFDSWYYKNDPSHVFFYHKCTIEWIKERFAFKDVEISGRLIVFSN